MRRSLCITIGLAFLAAATLAVPAGQTGNRRVEEQKKADDKKTDQKKDDKKGDDQKKTDDKKDEQKKDDKKTDDQKKDEQKGEVKKAKVKTLTDSRPYPKIDVAPGETFLVKLAANPTTGYTWLIVSPKDDKLRRDPKSTYEPDDKDQKVVGGGGIQTFTFTAQSAGEVEVELHYVRPFEKGRDPAKTFSFTVRIN